MTKIGWTPLRVRAVILDLDGLLVDSEPLHQEAFNTFLARHGIAYRFEEEEYGRVFVGTPVVENIGYLVERFALDLTFDEVLNEREAIFQSLIDQASNLRAMPGVIELLEELESRGIKVAVASGSPRRQVETMLRGLGIDKKARVVVAGTDVPKTKPAPDVYLKAVEELGVPTWQTMAVEDSATGITSAKAAGLTVIVVPNRYTRRQDLSQADFRLLSLREVAGLISGE